MRILLIDDHALFREGIALLLAELAAQPEIIEAGDCASGYAQLEANKDIQLIMMDLEMPGVQGVDGLRQVREDYPHIPVVVVSAHESVRNVTAAIEAGAMGFIPKSSTAPVMLAALNLVLAGGVYLPPLVLATVFSQTSITRDDSNNVTAASLGLSSRQADVLMKLLQGATNKEISRDLSLSPSTVKNHISAVFRALNVSSRTQAVIAAASLGLTLESFHDDTKPD